MRVKMVLSIFALVSLSALVGCGSGSTSNSAPSSPPTSSPSLQSIAVTSSSSSVAVGSTQQLKATGTYSDGSTKDLTSSATWTSSASSLATVKAGLVTGVKGGTVTITASVGAVSNGMAITVNPVLTSIAVSSANNTYSTTIGSNLQLMATANYNDGSSSNISSRTTWTSTASTVASVNSIGLVQAMATGAATIQAAYSGLTGFALVTVNGSGTSPSLKSIAVTPNPATAVLGSPLTLTATGTYSDGSSKNISSSVTWSSAATSVAVPGSDGVMTPLSAGLSTITATSGSVSGSAVLTVTNNLVALSISASASSVNVGSTLQLTALGTYQDGKPPIPLTNVTWSSSAASLATVSSTGLVSGVKGGSVTITAKFSSLSSSISLTIVPVLQSLSLSPLGPGILVGGIQQFKAMGNYNDGSTQDLTSSATWSSSDVTIASASPAGQVAGIAAGAITVTATSGAIRGSTIVNVVSQVYARFSGSYTFTLVSSDSRGPSFFAGVLTPDGDGNIAGVEDCNMASGVNQNVALAGSYVVYPDGRGTINFNPNACHSGGVAWRVVLSAGGAGGSLAEFDSLGYAKGTLTQQSAAAMSAASIKGTYAFRLSGFDGTGSEGVGVVGEFLANGSGTVSSGVEDVNDASTISAHVDLLSSAYSVSANGRGTLQVTTASGSTNYAIYVVDATKFYLLQIDAAAVSPTVLTGVAELQTAQTYTAANLKGTYSFLVERPVVAPAGQVLAQNEFAEIGDLTFDGVSALTGERNHFAITGSFTINVNGVNGRGGLNTCPATGTCDDQRLYFFYMVSPSKMFVLEAYTYPNWQSSNPVTGEADLQTGTPYSDSTLVGTFALHTAEPIAGYSQSLLWLNFDGTGNISGISDAFVNGATSCSIVTNAYYLYPVDLLGAGEIELTNAQGTQDFVFYLVSPQSAWIHALNPDQDGSLDQQSQ